MRERLFTLDLREFENSTGRAAFDKLRPRVLDLVTETTGVLDDVRRVARDSDFDAALALGLTEIATYQGRLEASAPDRPGWAVVVECASLLGRLARLVELAMKMVGGEDEQASRSDMLVVSLSVRRLYAQLMAVVAVSKDPAPEELVTRLRSAGTQMAMMVGRPVFAKLWPRDRLAIQAFQERIIDWLKDPAPTEGFNLWIDLTGLVTLLREVSRRSELLEHDQTCIQEMLMSIREGGEDDVLDLVPQLEPLFGLSSVFDEVIRERRTMTRSQWVYLLRSVRSLVGLRMMK